MAEQEQDVGVIFPLAGLETSCEFSRQPNDTAAAGTNVRTYEVVSDRGRGGSRCGLSRYANQRVNGVSPVQHVNILVDPQQPSLNAPTQTTPGDGSDEPTGLPRVIDPSTNGTLIRNFGRYVPSGGAGQRPSIVAGSTMVTLTRNGPVGDGFLQMSYRIGSGDETVISVFAIVAGVTPVTGSTTGMFVTWYVPDLTPYLAAVLGALTNAPAIAVTLTQTVAGPTSYYVPSFSVAPPLWTN